MKQLTLTTLFLLALSIAFSQQQTQYLDSMNAWRTNYIEHHELLKTKKERSLLRFYPIQSKYSVVASFERSADTAWFPMLTSGGTTTQYRKYGRLAFSVNDTVMHLFLYQSLDLLEREKTRNHLFIGFTDVTSGGASYGGGRYIDCEIGDIKDGRLVVDFNKAYNPYCAYTDGYLCPIPPKDNDLPVAILAGEMEYGKKKH